SFSRRRSDFDGDVQSIAHPRVSGNNAALRGTNDFFGKSASSPVSRGGRKQGQIQFASNRCHQRNRGSESGIRRECFPSRHAERGSLRLTKPFQGDLYSDVVRQRSAKRRSATYC